MADNKKKTMTPVVAAFIIGILHGIFNPMATGGIRVC